MSVLDRLDATRLCARWSVPYDDPSAWSRPVPVAAPVAPPAPAVDFSWRALARNPNALALSGMIGAVLVKDAVLTSVRSRW